MSELPEILQEAVRHGAKLRKQGAEFVGPCPRCGGRDRFAVNPVKQIFICRPVAGGDVLDLVQHVDACDYHAARSSLGLDQLRQAQKETGLKGRISGLKNNPVKDDRPTLASQDKDEADRGAAALRMWTDCITLHGTLGERYFEHHRSLDIRRLHDLTHCLRWHRARQCIVALMTDPITNAPIGVHRTILDGDGRKIERKMLGRQGVVRLSPDETVTMGLGLSEGLEDGFAVLLSGWAPVWVATSAGAIDRFPLLAGIEALTVFSDADPVGMTAADRCIARYLEAGRQARLCPPVARGQHAA